MLPREFFISLSAEISKIPKLKFPILVNHTYITSMHCFYYRYGLRGLVLNRPPYKRNGVHCSPRAGNGFSWRYFLVYAHTEVGRRREERLNGWVKLQQRSSRAQKFFVFALDVGRAVCPDGRFGTPLFQWFSKLVFSISMYSITASSRCWVGLRHLDGKRVVCLRLR